MARRFNKSDASYNARRRYYRSAERYLDKAESTTGATSARYKALATEQLKNAVDTYDLDAPRQKMSKHITDLAERLDYDVDMARNKIMPERGRQVSADIRKHRQRVISESTASLESELQDDDLRREREARALLNNPKIGRRILGGFVDIWRDKATDEETGQIDKSAILPALFDYFGVENVADLVEKVESIVGDKLYAEEDSDVMYEAVKIMVQIKIAENEYIG